MSQMFIMQTLHDDSEQKVHLDQFMFFISVCLKVHKTTEY